MESLEKIAEDEGSYFIKLFKHSEMFEKINIGIVGRLEEMLWRVYINVKNTCQGVKWDICCKRISQAE